MYIWILFVLEKVFTLTIEVIALWRGHSGIVPQNGEKDKWTDRGTDIRKTDRKRQMDRQTDGWMDGQTDRLQYIPCHLIFSGS